MERLARPTSHRARVVDSRQHATNSARAVKRLSVCIFFVCLLLHAPTALSTDNPDVESLIPRARELYNAGKYQDAVPLAQQILAYTENVFGPEDPLTAYSLSNLASLYTAMGEYAKAEPLYQRALQIREKALGPEHADTVVSLNNLGELYYQLGNYAKAEELSPPRSANPREGPRPGTSRHGNQPKRLGNALPRDG